MSVSVDGFSTYWCPFCGGVSHPSVGCEYAPGFVACRNCTVAAWQHIRMWMKQRRRKLDFYGAAARWPDLTSP
jgi:hypothetical protein